MKQQPPETNESDRLQRILQLFGGLSKQGNAGDSLSLVHYNLAHLLATVPTVVYTLAVQGDRLVPTWISENVTRITGYAQSDALAAGWWAEHVHPDDIAEASVAMQNLFDHGTLEHEYRFKHKSGHYIWILDQLRLTCDEAGKPTSITGVWTDVTDAKHAQQQVLRFKDALDKTLDMIFMFEPHRLELVYVNTGAMKCLGYQKDELLSMSAWTLEAEGSEGVFRDRIAPILRGEATSMQLETDFLRQDNTSLPVEISLQLVGRSLQDDGLFVAIVRDITERKKADRLKSEFIATVSHELRTPLTSIIGALSLASDLSRELSPQIHQLLEIANTNSQRLNTIVDDLLDMEKLASGNMRFNMLWQELMPLVNQAIDNNRTYAIQNNVSMALIDSADDVLVNVDANRFAQIMSNLLSNAAKFSPPSARIDVATKLTHHGTVRIEVIDHGEGIPKEFCEKIFQKFSQASSNAARRRSGTGLGLSITKELVENMGGTISFETELGVGTKFYLELPAKYPNNAARQPS